jgi:2-octaprenyl-6-methoxyphenol hydroxylase
MQALRAGGLAALSAIPPLSLLAMREGMTPGWRRNGLTKSASQPVASLSEIPAGS